MPANSSLNPSLDEVRSAANDARANFEASINDLARRAEKAVQEGLETLKSRSGDYSEIAGQRLDQAQTYVRGQVQERPLTTTLAALGVGIVVGFLLTGGRR